MCIVLSHVTHDEPNIFAQTADGFPRTALQVDFLKLLYDKMLELHNKHADGPEEWQYPRPSFKVCFEKTLLSAILSLSASAPAEQYKLNLHRGC